jgi:hypothetical protein
MVGLPIGLPLRRFPSIGPVPVHELTFRTLRSS